MPVSLKTLAAAAVVVVASLYAGASAQAQFVTYYSPVVAAPTPVVRFSPVTPVVFQQPVVTTVARPVVAAPVATTVVAPTAIVRTRFRPFLGRTVTRVRYRYAPVTYVTY